MYKMFLTPDGKVDEKRLVLETQADLINIKKSVDALLFSESGQRWLNNLTNQIATITPEADKERYAKVKRQIEMLAEYTSQWLELAVDTPERFVFFVRTKAQEITSGDEKKDYYMALYIRHDQLVALVTVLTRFLVELKRLTQFSADLVLDDPIIAGLIDYPLEKQIYLEAEEVYKVRQQGAT